LQIASRIIELRTDRHSVAPVDAHLAGRVAPNRLGQAGSRSTRSILQGRTRHAPDWGFAFE
jgi:hypothetical protein